MDLASLYPTLSNKQREELAQAAGIKPAYLHQLAVGFRRNPPVQTCKALVDADPRLTLHDLALQFARQEREAQEKLRSTATQDA